MAEGGHRRRFSPRLAKSPFSISPRLAKSPLSPSPNLGLAQKKNSSTESSDSKTRLTSGKKSTPMSAETSVRKSPRLVQSDQMSGNLQKCNGSAGISVTSKQNSKSQHSAAEAPSSEQTSLHSRRSPRFVNYNTGSSGRKGNSAIANELGEEIKKKQPALLQTSSRRSPRLIENNAEKSGKRLNSARQDGSAEKLPVTKKPKSGNKSKVSFFIGDPVPIDEARSRWPWRYEEKKV